MVPYIANLASGRNYLWSFSVAKYGAQTQTDVYHPDSGNGISTASGNPYITGNNPLDACVANTTTIQQNWVSHHLCLTGDQVSGESRHFLIVDLAVCTERSQHCGEELAPILRSRERTHSASLLAFARP